MPLQDVIHKLTEGSGSRWITLLLVFFGMVGLAVWYDLAAFKNLSTIEGMDASQVARNVAEGRGFTTGFIRPLSLHLLQRHHPEGEPVLDRDHPDLANAPLYPLLLGGALKAMPFPYPDTTRIKQFSIYTPDLYVAMFNQLLFLLAVGMVFRLGKRLFDPSVAWVSAAVFAGSELFWRLTTAGSSTLLLTLIVLGVIEVLSRLEPETREGATRSNAWVTTMALLAGALTGAAGLTRYSCGCLIVPVVLFMAGLPSPRRATLIACALSGFCLVLGPWVIRNQLVSGTPFGTAGYAIFQETSLFHGLELERTSNPDLSLMTGRELWHKLASGVRAILVKDLPGLGGSWVIAFFVVGLLVPFRSPTLARLRNFLVGSLVVLVLAQSMGRTGLSAESGDLSSENLLVIMAPAVFLFGVSLFFLLLDQFGPQLGGFRLFAMSLFGLVASAPLLFALLMPAPSALAYPPYYPPYIQEKSGWVGEKDLIMSDVPWAVAWYGQRQSVWLSLKYREDVSPKYRNDFYVLHNDRHPIRALYLSGRTMKSMETQSLAAWIGEGAGESWERAVSDWDSFVLLGVFLKHEIPTGFPLKRAPFGLLPELFLGDSERNERKDIKER